MEYDKQTRHSGTEQTQLRRRLTERRMAVGRRRGLSTADRRPASLILLIRCSALLFVGFFVALFIGAAAGLLLLIRFFIGFLIRRFVSRCRGGRRTGTRRRRRTRRGSRFTVGRCSSRRIGRGLVLALVFGIARCGIGRFLFVFFFSSSF